MKEHGNQKPGRASAARARKRRQKERYRQNKSGMLCISCIVLILLAVLSIQIFRLHGKNESLKEQERQLASQLEEEQERQEEILSYEQYVTTPEYVEQIAKSKLGLVYSNEIIFKERKKEP